VQKRVTLKDIAEELGVSITTVSKAIHHNSDISPARRQQILDLLKEREYVPNYTAQNLRGAKTKFISVVVSDNANPYYASVIRGAEAVLSRQGYHLLVINSNEDPETELEALKEMLALNVAGVLITPALGSASGVEFLRRNGVPYVLLNRYLEKGRDNYVIADDELAAYIGAQYLLKQYGNRVALVNYNMSITTAVDRRKGYERALTDFGMEVCEDLILDNAMDQQDGYEACRKLVEHMKGEPFSILFYCDYVASGALMYAGESGLKLCKDLAIMGIDGASLFSYFYPGLTSVHLPQFELGMRGAEILMDILEKGEKSDVEGTRVVFEPKLIIKGSA